MEPLVTVIVPIYNVEHYLGFCIESIKKQSYSNLEVILVNDGSKDNSGILCDEIVKSDKRFKVIHKENGGLSSARNAGLSVAKGDYVCFVDSDDWIETLYVEHLVSIAKKENADIVSCQFLLDTKRQLEDSLKVIDNYTVFTGEDIIIHYIQSAVKGGEKGNDISCCTKLYKREILNGYRFVEGMLFEDVVFNSILLSKIDRYVYSKYIGYHYYVNPSSITRKESYSDRVFDLEKGAQIIMNQIGGKSSRTDKELEKYMVKVHISILYKLLKMENVESLVIAKELKYIKNNYYTVLISTMPMSKKILVSILCILPAKAVLMLKNN